MNKLTIKLIAAAYVCVFGFLSIGFSKFYVEFFDIGWWTAFGWSCDTPYVYIINPPDGLRDLLGNFVPGIILTLLIWSAPACIFLRNSEKQNMIWGLISLAALTLWSILGFVRTMP